ncbi:MAB_1171c family putative transporter (plasmid) [Streptomyces sp. R39]|uniref:MAB_1171c family putative transporter n=1 Tax=Streptomyces sp. R39 TaxID=3238631 RepID=A0AB39R638_9ACTN
MSIVVYMASLLLVLAAMLLRQPRTTPRTPLTVATRVAVFLGATVFFCSAPATLAAVNNLTGIPNFGAPLTYGMISAYSCSLIILLSYWQGGPPAQSRLVVRISVVAYGSLIIAIIALFALSDADTERLTDLDTYYANTPYMQEMIILYLLGHLAGITILGVVCLRWARTIVTGWLRTGLWLIVGGCILDIAGFILPKVIAVVARWLGYNLDILSTSVAPPAASLGALACSIGFALPRLASTATTERHSLANFRALAPLWEAVKYFAIAPKAVPTLWPLRWQRPSSRLYHLEANIRDALLQLTRYLDRNIGEATYEAALANGQSAEQAQTAAEAAMIVDAIHRSSSPNCGPTGPPENFRIGADLVDLATAVNGALIKSSGQVATQ